MVRVKFYSDIAYSGFVEDLRNMVELQGFLCSDTDCTVSFNKEVWMDNRLELEGIIADYGGVLSR